MAFGRPSAYSHEPFHQGQGRRQQASAFGGGFQASPQNVEFNSGNRGSPSNIPSRPLGLTDRFSKIAEERSRAASQIAANAKAQTVNRAPPAQRPTPRSGPLRTVPRRGAAVQRQPIQLPRGGRGGPVRGPLAGRRAPPPAPVRGPAGRAGGVNKAGRRGAASRGGKAKKAAVTSKKPLTQSDLDSQLDAYLMKDANTAKARLDSDMDSYMAEGEPSPSTEAPTTL
ncbi:MAG: hypothetical protein DHS80DRAFT_29118 [Piptocephalis tieghemiana]|nr:MAG: hypothetical protein DHS80DRAFT_29118 [Piptocephalis tieghemiana]